MAFFWLRWWLTLILLIALGVLGIASWIKARQPNLSAHLGKLEAFEGWIGIGGLVWSLIMLLQWLQWSTSLLRYSFMSGVISLLIVAVMFALSLILALPQLKTLIGANDFTNKLGELAGKLAPHKMILGVVCLFFALYTLMSMGGLRAF